MRRIDALAVVEFLRDLDRCRTNEGRGSEAAVTKFINSTTESEPKPGSGACICAQSPEALRRTCEERWFEPFEKTKANMILDHRCPKHGEKAQPALWGRHKEKTLSVTPAQWLSLGVTYK